MIQFIGLLLTSFPDQKYYDHIPMWIQLLKENMNGN